MSAVTVKSDVEVVNLALDMVKEAPVASLDENRTAARWMKRNFTPIVNEVMMAHIWKFAMTRAELPADATAPAFEWTYRYKKPSDCLRILPLRYGGTLNGRLIQHVVEGDYILTNAPAPLKIRYLAVQPNVAKWPPTFVKAVACKLAHGVAHVLTGKQALVEMIKDDYREALSFAASVDSSEGSHADQYATEYDDARYYYQNPGDYY